MRLFPSASLLSACAACAAIFLLPRSLEGRSTRRATKPAVSSFRLSVDLRDEPKAFTELPSSGKTSTSKSRGRLVLQPQPKEEPAPRKPVPKKLPALTLDDEEAPEFAIHELELQPAGFTPYDRYLDTVRTVMANLEPGEPTMALACRLIREGRGFSYRMDDPYRADPPSVTAARRAGDCKSKSLWLYEQLGDPAALYVIGKSQRGVKKSHAWVYWRHEEQWWILDCTNRSQPIAAASVGKDRYIPYYSFSRVGSFRHSATRLLLPGESIANRAPVVAARPSSTVRVDDASPRPTPRSARR